MALYTWTHERTSQHLKADGEVLSETTNTRESAVVTEEGLRIPVKGEGAYYRSVYIGFSSIQKGTTWRWNMKQFDGHWVLDYWEFVYPRRTSFLTGYRRQYRKEIDRWSDYGKVN